MESDRSSKLYVEKEVARRVQIIIADPDLMKVYEKFGGRVFRRSSVYHGLKEFLETNHVKGKVCVEIGSWNGLTAIVLSKFFDKIISFDIVNNKEKYLITDYLGIDNIQFVHVDNNHFKAKEIEKLKFDFAYLDGDHAADTEEDFKLVKRCKNVLFHEYWKIQPAVWNLVNGLQPREVTKGEIFALWTG